MLWYSDAKWIHMVLKHSKYLAVTIYLPSACFLIDGMSSCFVHT